MYENPEHLFGGRAAMLSLIGSIYETVERPELWPEVLGALNRAVGASQSAMIFHKLGAPGAGIGFGLQKTSGLPEETAVAYQGHYHQIDEWFLRGGALTSGWVGSGDEIVERAELQRTEFYNEFLRHHEIEQQMGAVLERSGDVMSTITLMRADPQRPFGEREIALLREIAPHARRALLLSAKTMEASSVRTGLDRALDALGQAVFALGVDGVLLHRNETGEAMLRSGDALAVRGGKLCAKGPTADVRLQEAIRKVAASGGTAGLLLDEGAMRVTAMACPGMVAGLRTVTVLLLAQREVRQDRRQVLRTMYGLTPVEASVADGLANGLELRELAASLGVGYEAVRFHLKNVFVKMKARRQSEVVRLILGLPGV